MRLSFRKCNPSTRSPTYGASIYFVASERIQPKCSVYFGVDLKIADDRRIETEIVTTDPKKKDSICDCTPLCNCVRNKNN